MTQRSVMRITSVLRRMWLIRRWGMCCIICGETFHTLSTVTYEHIKPESMGGTKAWSNIAPSHFNCNKARETKSLLEAAAMLAEKRAKMGEKQFQSWLRRPIPNCDMPKIASVPLTNVTMTVPKKWTGGDQYAR